MLFWNSWRSLPRKRRHDSCCLRGSRGTGRFGVYHNWNNTTRGTQWCPHRKSQLLPYIFGRRIRRYMGNTGMFVTTDENTSKAKVVCYRTHRKFPYVLNKIGCLSLLKDLRAGLRFRCVARPRVLQGLFGGTAIRHIPSC